jgi:hypothetical protein
LLSPESQSRSTVNATHSEMESRDVAFGISLPSKQFTQQQSSTFQRTPEHTLLRSTDTESGCRLLFVTQYPVGAWYHTIDLLRGSSGFRVGHFSEAAKPPSDEPSRASVRLRLSVNIECSGRHCDATENPAAPDPDSLIQVVAIQQKNGAQPLGPPSLISLPQADHHSRSGWIAVPLAGGATSLSLSLPTADDHGSRNKLLKVHGSHNSKNVAVRAGDGFAVAVTVRPGHFNRTLSQVGQKVYYVIERMVVSPVAD